MAREESDREDLLREATALVERIELGLINADSSKHIVVGFRSNGAASFFFGSRTVYQFNAAGELRRAFCEGQLIKASRGRLISLRRNRVQNETQLLSRELNDAEQAEFLESMSKCLREFVTTLNSRNITIVGQVPDNANVLSRVQSWLAKHEVPTIARSARVEAERAG